MNRTKEYLLEICLIYRNSDTMASGKTRMEIACTISWFSNWSDYQRHEFGKTILNAFKDQSAPLDESLESLMELMGKVSINKENKECPSVFDCQLKIFSKWFSGWVNDDKTHFIDSMSSKYPEFTESIKTQLQ